MSSFFCCILCNSLSRWTACVRTYRLVLSKEAMFVRPRSGKSKQTNLRVDQTSEDTLGQSRHRLDRFHPLPRTRRRSRPLPSAPLRTLWSDPSRFRGHVCPNPPTPEDTRIHPTDRVYFRRHSRLVIFACTRQGLFSKSGPFAQIETG